MLAWKNNWAYANDIPKKSTRGSMTLPRDVQLGEYCGKTVVFSYPVREVVDAIRAGAEGWKHSVINLDEDSREVLLKGDSGWNLKIGIDDGMLKLDRSATKNPDFSEKFQKSIDIPVPLKAGYRIDVFSGPDSAELFVDGGAIAATLLFP